MGLAKAGLNIRDRLFLERVIRFLSPLSKYSSEQRRAFLDLLDEKERVKASEYLILYLDRLNSIEKASMLGRVFEAYLVGEIDYRKMLYFVDSIDSVFILVWQDFHKAIKDYHDKKTNHIRISEDDALALEKVGFYKEEHKPDERLDLNSRLRYLRGVKRKLVLTNAGWDFIKVVFQLWPDAARRRIQYLFSVELTE